MPHLTYVPIKKKQVGFVFWKCMDKKILKYVIDYK
jgi:hypothetical protein